MVFYVLGTIVWLACIAATYVVAKSKGRSAVLWAILAVFFTWVALLVVALLPVRPPAYGR
jgi:hypothetical protein